MLVNIVSLQIATAELDYNDLKLSKKSSNNVVAMSSNHSLSCEEVC